MEPRMSEQSEALIKTILYEEIAMAEERGNRAIVNSCLDAINDLNRLLDKKYFIKK